MKKIIIALIFVFIVVIAFAANTSFSINQSALNSYFKVISPINGSTQINVFGSKEKITYNINNVTITIKNNKVLFSSNIKIQSASVNVNSSLSGTLNITYSKNILHLKLTNIKSSNSLLLPVIQILQSSNSLAFNYKIPNMSYESTYSNKTIKTSFIPKNITVANKKININGELSFVNVK